MKMDDEDTGSIPVLQTSKMPNCTFDDEKPTFHTNQNPPGPSEPFQLLGSIQVPYTINRYLRDYQRDGVQFIHDNYVKSRGCILGDDMGLGKTVQVISFLAAVLHKTGTWEDVVNNRPEFLQTQVSSKQSKVKKVFLIVSPLSVLYNWKDELDTWGHFKTVVVHGVRKEEELARVTRGRCEIALTTYETLRICLDLFNSIDWDAVIVDEVHKLKNNKSQITQAMKMLRCKVRVGLTGTILQNNLEELWCVMDWAIPGCLGTLGSFKNRFSDPIEQGQKHSATKRALAEGRKAVQSLAKRLSQRFLRRTKALISDQLPKKDDRVVYCSLTEFQQSVYQEVLYTEDVKLLLQSSEKCPCRSGRSKRKCCFKQNSERISVRNLYFSYLAILRKVANHVALLQSKEGTSVKQKKYVTTICEQVFKKFPEFSGRCEQAAFEALSDPIYSGKMKVLQRLINHFITRKDKVLLFSLSTKLLDILESHCMAEGLEYRRLDGTTKSKDRIHIVKEFNSTSDINLCLVSTMAGGLGLNFVGANVVVLFDPTWNPANDLQAIDRAYRIGQCRDVTVFRLISLGTVEEIIYLRQIYKQQLQSSVIGKENARRYFEAVQGTEGQAGELFGIRNLFRFQTDGTCLTRCILEREGRVEVGIKTARTLAMDDWVQELEPGLVSSHGSSGQAVKSATVSSPGVLDFSSASEDEDPCASRSKPTGPTKPDECRTSTSSAANVNLCALLQKNLTHWAVKASECSEESQSEENVMGSDQEEIKAAERKTKWKLYSDSEEDSEFQEQDDVHHNKARQSDIKVPNKKQRQNWARLVEQRCRRGKEIESFTSSEDEAPSNDVKSINRHASVTQQNTSALQSQIKKHHHAAPKRVQFTSLKSPAGHSREVQALAPSTRCWEVSYTHSNQKVVGSSKTENCISRAALRDVFELNKHSQLPANHLLDLSETLSSESDKDEGQHLSGQKFHLKHLATCSIRTSIHTNSAIISVGQTPAAVRKQQLKEMAQFFRAKSVHEFAEELISSDSAQRLHRLREFYSHSCPDLTDVIQKTFPKPVPELNSAASPSTASHSMTRPNSSSKRTHVSSIRKAHNSEAAGEKSVKKRRTKALSTTVLHPLSDGQSEPVQDKHQKTTNSSQAGETLKDREHSLTHPDSSAELAHFHKDHTTGTDSIHPNKNLINDLIGDTSILDDLFKPKKSADRPKPTTPPVSTPAVRTTNRAKDFWDILNEGNEESINKLTDPSQVEKMCRTVTVPARSKREHLLESSQLWKKNEKFLWK